MTDVEHKQQQTSPLSSLVFQWCIALHEFKWHVKNIDIVDEVHNFAIEFMFFFFFLSKSSTRQDIKSTNMVPQFLAYK